MSVAIELHCIILRGFLVFKLHCLPSLMTLTCTLFHYYSEDGSTVANA